METFDAIINVLLALTPVLVAFLSYFGIGYLKKLGQKYNSEELIRLASLATSVVESSTSDSSSQFKKTCAVSLLENLLSEANIKVSDKKMDAAIEEVVLVRNSQNVFKHSKSEIEQDVAQVSNLFIDAIYQHIRKSDPKASKELAVQVYKNTVANWLNQVEKSPAGPPTQNKPPVQKPPSTDQLKPVEKDEEEKK